MLDISEQKLAEEALRESEEKYRTILESIEDGYYETDFAGTLPFLTLHCAGSLDILKMN